MSFAEQLYALGSDPEWFLKQAIDEKPVSAIGKFEGTKDAPVPLANGVTVQVDNCAVEYGTAPADSLTKWVDVHVSAKEQIAEMASSMALRLHIVPSVVFAEDELQDERAWVFGCEPDLNAWSRKWNPRPEAANPFLRSAGGHLHFGLRAFSAPVCYKVVQAADMYMALPGMLVDTDDRRRELYGKAGACRLKPYGVEWRTASNFWTISKERVEWVWRTAHRMLRDLDAGLVIPKDVRVIINEGDRVGARSVIERYGLEVPA